MRNYTGCPCGCLTKRPWFDDPDCILNHIPPPPPVPTQILAGIFGPLPEDAGDE